MNNKRIAWVDVTKFICILCVFIDHIDGCSYTIINFFSPFFLNCFFFTSGYCYNNKRSFTQHIIKKVTQLFVPWFIYSNLNILLSHIYTYYGHDDLVTELLKNLLQVRGYGDYLWFVACLFVAYIPFYYLVKYYDNSNKEKKIFIIILLFIIAAACSTIREYLNSIGFKHIWGKTNLLWHGEYLIEAMFYMLLGYEFKSVEKLFDKYLKYNIFVFIIYCFVLYLRSSIPFNSNYFYFSYNTILSLFGMSIVVSLSKTIKPNKYINYVGQNTLLYFSLHNKTKTCILILLESIYPNIISLCSSNLLVNIIYVFLYSFVISIILIPITYIINKYLPWTIGKKNI